MCRTSHAVDVVSSIDIVAGRIKTKNTKTDSIKNILKVTKSLKIRVEKHNVTFICT